MRLVFRYLAKESLLTMLAVTSILVLVFMSHQFAHYLGDAAVGRLTPKAVLLIMCIQIPLLLGFISPLGWYLGILLAYGRLYADNEMTILCACGLSKGQLLMKSLKLSAFVTLFVTLLMIWVEPKMAWYRDKIIAYALASSPIEKVSPGSFQQIGNWVLYTEGITRDKETMLNIFAASNPSRSINENTPLDVVIATKAFQKISPQRETFIVLSEGSRYLGLPGDNNYQWVKFKEYGIRLPDKKLEMGSQEEFMSIQQLWRLRHNNANAAAELQWRMAMPISVIILTLFAVPLSEVKPRKGRFAQILPAVLFYIIYLDLLFLSRAWVEKQQLSAAWGLWIIHGSMLLLALLILYVKFPLTLKRSVSNGSV